MIPKKIKMCLTYIYYVGLLPTLILILIYPTNLTILYIGVDVMNYLPINETILNTHKTDC